MEASGSSKRQPHWTRGLGSGRRCTPSPGWVGGGGQAGQGVVPSLDRVLWATAPRSTLDEVEALPLLDEGQLYHFMV